MNAIWCYVFGIKPTASIGRGQSKKKLVPNSQRYGESDVRLDERNYI